jgi:hypothetical protein
MYVKQDVICPKCKNAIAFDDFDDCFDISYDACGGEFFEHCAYTCPECNHEFSASIEYELKFKRVVQ